MRRHGRDVAVLHVGHDLIDVARDSMARSDRQAADLRRLHSHAMRARLRSERIAVVAWPIDTATDVAVEQVLALHRQVVKRRR